MTGTLSPASAPISNSSPDASNRAGTGSGCILVAEDDSASRALIAQILERTGYDVLLADDGQRVFELLER